MDVTPYIPIIVAIINGIFAILAKKKRIKIKGKPIWIALIVTVAIFAVVAVVLFVLVPSVRITYPNNAAGVGNLTTVKGTSQYVPEGQVIWVVVYAYKVNLYYPMEAPAVVQTNGDWTSGATFGGVKDERFDIIAVLASQTAQDAFDAYITNSRNINSYPGMKTLPVGAEIKDKITVIRNTPTP